MLLYNTILHITINYLFKFIIITIMVKTTIILNDDIYKKLINESIKDMGHLKNFQN